MMKNTRHFLMRGSSRPIVRDLAQCRSGQGTLAFILIASGVIVLIGVTLAFLLLSFANTSSGFQAANRALAAASSGVQDALLRLTRDNQFDSAGYSVTLPSGESALVVVASIGSGEVAITSSASVLNNSRKLRVLASVSPYTGQVTVLSWQQVAF